MDFINLLAVLGRPWFMEPQRALSYAQLAAQVIKTGSMPASDKRWVYGDGGNYGFGPVFRVDKDATVTPTGPVQIIRMNYAVAKYDFCGVPGTQTLQQFIAAANADDAIKSIVLWIDSPGGQCDGTEQLAQAVKSSAKPIVAYSDGMMCSAAYWVGSSAREVVVNGANNGWNASIGSIGTMARWADDSGKNEREGVKIHTVFATQSKDKWGSFLAANAGDYAELIRELDGLNESFLSAVKANRDSKIDLEKENVLTGKVYNATEAKAYGLIDKIGDLQYSVKRSLQFARSAPSTVINNSNKQNNMAKFPKTSAAAKAQEEFDVLNEGIWVTEEHLNNVESALTSQETTITSLTADNASQLATIGERDTLIAEHVSTIASRDATITTLQAQVATLSRKDSKAFSAPGSEKDDDLNTQELNAATDPTSSINQYADRMLSRF